MTILNKRASLLSNVGLILGPCVLVSLFYFWHSISKLVPGMPLVMVSVALGTVSICLSISSRNRTSFSSEEVTSKLDKAGVMGNAACQMAILGIANISSVYPSHSKTRMLLDYVGMAFFFALTLSSISFADRESQTGGYVPVSFLGFPRSRRLIFAVYAGYCMMCPIGIGSIEFSVAKMGWRPIALQSSQACLLIECLTSLLCAELLRRRYHDHGTASKKPGWRVIPLVLGIMLLLGNAIIWFFLNYSFYVYGLSAVAVVCLLISASYLWRSTEK
jgi:hypothetical protein